MGINTTSPADELHVNATSANVNMRLTRDTNTGARISGSDGASTPVLKFDTIASGTATERMRIDSSGNVGIGVSPAFRLHVKETPANGAYSATTNMEATTRFHSSEATTGSYTAIQLAANNGNSALGWWNIGTISTSTNYDNDLVFQTARGQQRTQNDSVLIALVT